MAATESVQKPAVTQTTIILNCAGPEFIQVYDQFTWETEADKNNPDKVILKLEGYCSPQGNCSRELVPVLETSVDGAV